MGGGKGCQTPKNLRTVSDRGGGGWGVNKKCGQNPYFHFILFLDELPKAIICLVTVGNCNNNTVLIFYERYVRVKPFKSLQLKWAIFSRYPVSCIIKKVK